MAFKLVAKGGKLMMTRGRLTATAGKPCCCVTDTPVNNTCPPQTVSVKCHYDINPGGITGDVFLTSTDGVHWGWFDPTNSILLCVPAPGFETYLYSIGVQCGGAAEWIGSWQTILPGSVGDPTFSLTFTGNIYNSGGLIGTDTMRSWRCGTGTSTFTFTVV